MGDVILLPYPLDLVIDCKEANKICVRNQANMRTRPTGTSRVEDQARDAKYCSKK